MIDKYLGAESEGKFLDSVGIGRATVSSSPGLSMPTCAAWLNWRGAMRTGGSGGTDASVIAICEALSITTVATVNRRDFANVQPRHVGALAIVP